MLFCIVVQVCRWSFRLNASVLGIRIKIRSERIDEQFRNNTSVEYPRLTVNIQCYHCLKQPAENNRNRQTRISISSGHDCNTISTYADYCFFSCCHCILVDAIIYECVIRTHIFSTNEQWKLHRNCAGANWIIGEFSCVHR